MKRPILVALVGYIIGILWELYLKINIAPSVILLILITLIYKKYQKSIYLMIITMILSNIHINVLNYKYEYLSNYIDREKVIIGTIISEADKNDYYNTYTIRILEINKNRKYRNTQLLIKTNKDLDYGDTILFKANYKKADEQRNYKGFDYSKYLKTINVYGILENVSIEKVLKKNNLNKLDLFFHNTSIEIKNKINSILEKNESELLIALLTGDNSNLDEKIKDNFKNSGIYHILAISGMHMTYIIVILEKISNFSNINKNKKKIIQILGIVFFIQLTIKSVSIIRAGIMAILSILAFIFKRKSDVINNICIAMLLILISNPYSIENISFQLSFGGIIGIILLNNPYKKVLSKLKIKGKLLEGVSSILVAQTIIIPIMIVNFHTISLTFLISNLLAEYVIGAIIILGFITIFSSFISIYLAITISKPLSLLIKILLLITKLGSLLPFSKIYVTRPPIYLIIIYYVLILKLSIYKDLWNNEIKKILIFIKYKKIYILTIIIILTNTVIVIPKDLNIYFIDVGQGDATLIITPHNKKILIDSGGSENYDIGRNTLIPYLLSRGIKKIDYAIISHFDTDHMGGLLIVLQELTVDNVIISKQIIENENYDKLKKIIKKRKVNVIFVKQGDIVQIEKNLYFDILWPNNLKQVRQNSLNNNSIVCKLYYKKFSMIFTGDIEEMAESQILQEYKNNFKILESTILKVAHHGSKTSSTQRFLNTIKPKIALIGVGKNNKFGHPNDEVIERLKENGTKIYRTDESGEINITINKKGKIIKIQKCINNAK